MKTPGRDHYADTAAPIRLGLIIILLTFVGFGGWAAFAPLSQGAVASGRLIVESQRKEIQHLEGGIVSLIRVRDGDQVTAGDILITLEDTRALAQVQIIEGQVVAYKALEARLLAERNGDAELTFPGDLVARAETRPEIAKVMEGQRDLFTARGQALAGQTEILEQRATQLQEVITGLKSQVAAKSQQLRYLEEEISGLQELFAKGHASKPRLLALQRTASETSGERGRHLADIASAELKVGETRLEIIQLEKSFQEEVVSELRTVQQRLSDLTEQLVAARDVLQRTEVRAPVDGVVVGLKLFTLGGVINPGQTLLEIVPQDQKLVVQARVQGQDIERVFVGAETEVRLLPFQQRLLPILLGRITALSADTLEDERTGERYYLAHVEILPDEAAKLEGHVLLPGMPADVIVKAGEYTVLQYLTGPLADMVARAFKE